MEFSKARGFLYCKAGCLHLILQRDKDSMIPPNYYGSKRLGTYRKNGYYAWEERSPYALA
jgi:hypothetical protein